MNYLDRLKSKLSMHDDKLVPESIPGTISNDSLQDDVHIDDKPKAAKKPSETLLLTDNSKQFFLSQTLIKEITNKQGDYKEVCPRYVNEVKIKKNYRYITEPMLHGIFGESLILGSGAKGQCVTDLPKHKTTGEKLIPQRNIEEQAIRAKLWCAERFISIIPGINTQFPIVKKMPNGRLFKTEFDIFPTSFLDDDGNLKLAIIDLKFTSDVNSNWGNYSWGAPQFMDFLQADSSYWLLQDFDMDLNIKYHPEKEQIYRMIFENKAHKKAIENENIIFIYFVIGYKAQPLNEQVKFYHREYREANGSLIRQTEFFERARKTIAQLNEWHGLKWPVLKSSFCTKCPVSVKNGGYCNEGSTVTKV